MDNSTAESPQVPQLSSTYWELHRNCLLLSSFALVMSLPGVHASASQPFLWVTLNDVGLDYIRVLAILSATYAIFTYQLEWLSEAVPVWRVERSLYATTRERVAALLGGVGMRATAALQDFRAAIDAQLEEGDRLQREVFEPLHPPRDVAEACERAVSRLEAAEDGRINLHYPLIRSFDRLLQVGSPPPEQLMAAVRSAVSAAARTGALAGVAEFRDVQAAAARERLSRAGEAAEQLARVLAQIATSTPGLRPLSRQITISLARSELRVLIRLLIIGAVVPISLYLFALIMTIRAL